MTANLHLSDQPYMWSVPNLGFMTRQRVFAFRLFYLLLAKQSRSHEIGFVVALEFRLTDLSLPTMNAERCWVLLEC